jgi:uncharacterized delta-60 repeat protein
MKTHTITRIAPLLFSDKFRFHTCTIQSLPLRSRLLVAWLLLAMFWAGALVAQAQNTAPSFTLPTAQAAGVTWIPVAGTLGWSALAVSADGTKMVAAENISGGFSGGGLFTSSDTGGTWTQRDGWRIRYGVATSADGRKLLAAEYAIFSPGGYLYTSPDYGVTWAQRASLLTWNSVASSADGTKLVAAVKGGQIYASTDSGTTWLVKASSPSLNWVSIASSADGSKLVAVVDGGFIHTFDSALNTTWQQREASRTWQSVTSSADGIKLAAVSRGATGKIYTSTNSGVNWTPITTAPTTNWAAITNSANGNQIAAAVSSGQIYVSDNAGTSWTARESARAWTAISYSADGSTLAAADGSGAFGTGGNIYVSRKTVASPTIVAGSMPVTFPNFATNISPSISAGFPGEAGQQVTGFFLTNTNPTPGLFGAFPFIDPTTGSLTVNPGAIAGTGNFTVVAKDNGGTAGGGVDTSAPQSFSIVITPNTPPVITSNGGGATTNISIPENTTGVTTVTDIDPDVGQNHQFAKVNSPGHTDEQFFTINISTGLLTFTNPPDYEGAHGNTYYVRVIATDAVASDSQDLTITVTNVNEAPTIATIPSQSTSINTPTSAIPLTIGDPDTALTSLTVSSIATPPQGAIVFGGTGANRTLTLTPALNYSGMVSVTVTVSDGSLSAAKTFAIWVGNGAIDPGWTAPTNVGFVNWWVSTPMLPGGGVLGNALFVFLQENSAIWQLQSTGVVEPAFTAVGTSGPSDSGGTQSVIVQNDGSILLGGSFGYVGSTAGRGGIARVTSTGALDPTFNFDSNTNTTRNGADSEVLCMAVQKDGMILIGGIFTHVNGVPANHIARLKADGSLDPNFNLALGGADDTVWTVAVDSNGKIVIGGDFLSVNGSLVGATGVNRIARLNSNGSLDSTFNASGATRGCNASVKCVAVQADGNLVISGDFTSVNGTTANHLARLNSTGSLDPGFNLALGGLNGGAESIAIQADGKLVLGGFFTSVNGTSGIRGCTRLNLNGTTDTSFLHTDPTGATAHYINSVTLQTDGKVLVGGGGAHPNSSGGSDMSLYLPRLLNGPASQSISNTGNSQLLWTRSGTGPELINATFEFSTNNGSTWTMLGNGTRVGTTPNWQITGLTLPTGVAMKVRARGRATSGARNASSGLIEQVLSTTVANNPPQIVSNGAGATATINYPENSTTPVAIVSATDIDAGQSLQYSKSGQHANFFTLNSGILSFINPPDYETPLAGGTNGNSYTVTVTVSDNGNPILSDSQTFTINVTDALDKPDLDTGVFLSLTSNSVTLTGILNSDGGSPILGRGFVWAVSPLVPTLSTTGTVQVPVTGTALGGFIGNVTGLPANTMICYRAYAINAVGVAYGSGTSCFTTPIGAPTVTTATPANITTTSADLGGNVVNDGGSAITDRGIVWATTPTPVIQSDHKVPNTAPLVTGPFVANITGLPYEAIIYVRAYSLTNLGLSYGAEINFQTPPAPIITVAGGPLGPIPDFNPAGRDIFFSIAGLNGVVQGVTVSFTLSPAPRASDLTVQLISPNGIVHPVFSMAPTNSRLGGGYTFSDAAFTRLSTTIPQLGGLLPAGTYLAETIQGPNSLWSSFGGIVPNGTWTLRFVDNVLNSVGTVSAASLSIDTAAPGNTNIPPFIPGNPVTICLDNADANTNYVLERSTDLTNWTILQTTPTSNSGSACYVDPTPPLPSGFYRFIPR